MVRRLFFKKNIFHPSPAVVQHFLCTLVHFYRTSGESNNFGKQPWIFACTSRPNLIQLEKVLQFLAICVKVVLLAVSANFCKKRSRNTHSLCRWGNLIANLRELVFNIKTWKKHKKSRFVYILRHVKLIYKVHLFILYFTIWYKRKNAEINSHTPAK